MRERNHTHAFVLKKRARQQATCARRTCRLSDWNLYSTVSDPILTWPRLHVILYIMSVPSVFSEQTRKSRFGKAHGPERANYIVPRVHPTMQLYQGLWNPARFLVLCCCRGCCIMCFFPHKKMFHKSLSCPPPDKQEDTKHHCPLIIPYISWGGWAPQGAHAQGIPMDFLESPAHQFASVTKCSLEASRTWMPPAKPTSVWCWVLFS